MASLLVEGSRFGDVADGRGTASHIQQGGTFARCNDAFSEGVLIGSFAFFFDFNAAPTDSDTLAIDFQDVLASELFSQGFGIAASVGEGGIEGVDKDHARRIGGFLGEANCAENQLQAEFDLARIDDAGEETRVVFGGLTDEPFFANEFFAVALQVTDVGGVGVEVVEVAARGDFSDPGGHFPGGKSPVVDF